MTEDGTEPAPMPMQVVCSWCGIVLTEGQPPPSHGICGKCLDHFFSDDSYQADFTI